MKNKELKKMSREAGSRYAGKKTFEGKVLSLKTPKTAVVVVERKTKHPLYKRVLKRSKRFKADTGDLTLNVGDKVKIVETRPLSSEKHFKVMEVLGR